MKKSSNGNTSVSLEVLKKDSVTSVARDIEKFVFENKIDMSKFKHNKNNQNANQSQQYIMDLID
jgi:hypothetical protein